MMLLTKALKNKLLANGANPDKDHAPVLKLFTPWTGCTWLFSEMDPDNEDHLFGLCDLGQGCAELGDVSLSELTSIVGPMGLKIERDLHFAPVQPMSGYSADAQSKGYILA